MKPTGPTNPVIKQMISEISERGYKEKIDFLINLAKQLKVPRRKRVSVNLSKLQRVCKDGDVIIIPGKLLSYGELNKKITISPMLYSNAAKEKIEKSGSKFISIRDLVEKNPTGKNIRLIK